MAFARFAALPPELQLHVWNACFDMPSMHIFDVCSPQNSKRDRDTTNLNASSSLKALSAASLTSTVYLDALRMESQACGPSLMPTTYHSDPSMYHFVKALRQTSKSSRAAIQTRQRHQHIVSLQVPSLSRVVEIPSSDVIMLRFEDRKNAGIAAARTVMRSDATHIDAERSSQSSLGTVLENQWSPGMAQTLRTARKIAFDITEPWIAQLGGEIAYEEISFLVCTIQHELEVLYLVENCVGRCKTCEKQRLRAVDLQRKQTLWQCLNYQDKTSLTRPPDVIQAVGQRYVEICDFESLGWDDTHPSFVFARMIDETIRSQQHGASRGKFQGVRILVTEQEPGTDRRDQMQVQCQGRKQGDSALQLAMCMLPGFAEAWA